MRSVLLALVLLACNGGEPGDARTTPDRASEVEPLELPPLDGIDPEVAFTEALKLVLTVDGRPAWRGHVDTLAMRHLGCPDLYAGAPPDSDMNGGDDGLSWHDYCDASDGVSWAGWAHWETDVAAEGDVEDPGGRSWEASRTLQGRAKVREADGVLFELDGTATESVFRATGEDFDTWTWSSRVEGTVTGALSFEGDTPTPGGWRTDLYRHLTGGETQRLTARGNVYLFDGRLHDRFDSLAMDFEMSGPGSVGPEDCALEPRGWIGLRDENAYWYDLVFLPRHQEDSVGGSYPNDPLSVCDGCGTLYVRGVETGEVCLDFAFLWEADIEPPPIESFILTLHDLP